MYNKFKMEISKIFLFIGLLSCNKNNINNISKEDFLELIEQAIQKTEESKNNYDLDYSSLREQVKYYINSRHFDFSTNDKNWSDKFFEKNLSNIYEEVLKDRGYILSIYNEEVKLAKELFQQLKIKTEKEKLKKEKVKSSIKIDYKDEDSKNLINGYIKENFYKEVPESLKKIVDAYLISIKSVNRDIMTKLIDNIYYKYKDDKVIWTIYRLIIYEILEEKEKILKFFPDLDDDNFSHIFIEELKKQGAAHPIFVNDEDFTINKNFNEPLSWFIKKLEEQVDLYLQ